jgi:hypothetical protein
MIDGSIPICRNRSRRRAEPEAKTSCGAPDLSSGINETSSVT